MPSRLRLGVVATHPIQYHAPLFRELVRRGDVDLTVLFAHRPTAEEQGEGFGVPFQWDVDLTSGYRVKWLLNRAQHPSTSSFGGCDTPEVGGVIRDCGFDSLLVMGWHSRTYWQAMTASWRSGIPVLVRGDSQLLTDDQRSKRLAKRALYPLFMKRFAACLSVGSRSEEYFRHYGARRIVHSPHFVDNEFFAERAASVAPHRDALRERWGVPRDAFVCLFAGKFIEKKRPLDLVHALASLRDAGVWGLFVGDGELRAQCEAEAKRLGANVRFLGFMNQSTIPSAYVVSDVLVLPSDARETWGLVVNEAMASGRPAIVSRDVGCSPDLIVESETGAVVARGDIEGLTNSIARLAADPELVLRMGGAARARVATFSCRAAADGIVIASAAFQERAA